MAQCVVTTPLVERDKTFPPTNDQVVFLSPFKDPKTVASALSLFSTVYVHTEALASFFESVFPHVSQTARLTLITQKTVATEFLNDCRLARWFASNRTSFHPKISGIPLGVSDDSVRYSFLSSIADKSDTVFATFSQTTKERVECMTVLKKKGDVCFVSEARLPFSDYVSEMGKHRFVACPAGMGGRDTHRIWEALYLGCTPIVLRGPVEEGFACMFPILVVDSWDDVKKGMVVPPPAPPGNYDAGSWKDMITV